MNHFKLRNVFVIGTLASAMAMATTGCNDSDDTGSMMNSGSSSMESSNSDMQIVDRIEADLAEENTLSESGSDINVAIANGVVTLTGTVSDAAAKSAAERTARGVDGVQSVRNDITLARASAAASGGSSDRQAGAQAGARTSNDGSYRNGTQNDTQNDAERAADSAGDAMSDTWITTKVKAELLSDDISSGFEVGVETVDGWVTLSGQLGNREAVDHIRNLVENVDGVRGVDISSLSVVAQN